MARLNNSKQLLSDVLPPLIFGTATFNYQFNVDPYALNPNTIVSKALETGIRAFDTSPYYGPAEEILGKALSTSNVRLNPAYQRENYFILTKVGRIASNIFDYSPEWIRYSVRRSCRRLRTSYLDVVYCHDVEFVSKQETLTAIKELRRIRDEEGTLKYIGICGYPVSYLCELAEYILEETGEPLDIVQSYANFTLQNQLLSSEGLERLVKAGVDIVPNASPLGMGLLRSQGVPIGAMGNWHPAPDGLREACAKAADWVDTTHGERLETIAIRFAMESWLKEGSKVGSRGILPGVITSQTSNTPSHQPSTDLQGQRLGVSVMGVSTISELLSTMRIWRSVIDGLSDPEPKPDYFNNINDTDEDGPRITADPGTGSGTGSLTPDNTDTITDHEWSLTRRQHIRSLSSQIRNIIGAQWTDYAWSSPDEGFVNQRKVFGVLDTDKVDDDDDDGSEFEISDGLRDRLVQGRDDAQAQKTKRTDDVAMLTPPSERDLRLE